MNKLKKAFKWLVIVFSGLVLLSWLSSGADEPATKGGVAGGLIMLAYGLFALGKALDRIENKISQLQNAIRKQTYPD